MVNKNAILNMIKGAEDLSESVTKMLSDMRPKLSDKQKKEFDSMDIEGNLNKKFEELRKTMPKFD